MLKNNDSVQKFSIRKLSVGAASVLISLAFMSNSQNAKAAEMPTAGSNATKTTQVDKNASVQQADTQKPAEQGTQVQTPTAAAPSTGTQAQAPTANAVEPPLAYENYGNVADVRVKRGKTPDPTLAIQNYASFLE